MTVDIEHAAKLMVGRYGADAVAVAAMRADQLQALDDLDGRRESRRRCIRFPGRTLPSLVQDGGGVTAAGVTLDAELHAPSARLQSFAGVRNRFVLMWIDIGSG
jgi:hypothetical protein